VPSARYLIAVLVAVLLVFAQQASALHALSHLGDASPTTEQEKHQPGKACDQCLGYATLHGAAPSGPLFVALHDLSSHFHAHDAPADVLPGRAHYRSRAPPALS
jgi:hypothetical protein